MANPRAPRSGAPLATPRERGVAFSVPEDARYEPGGILGRGGWGEVRAVHDRRLQRVVAAKTTRDDDPGAREDLIREARLTARLDHPNIVPVHDAGDDDEGRPFYTMPVLNGETLAAALDRAGEGRLALVRNLLDAAHAVAYAHSRGILHRDLKPDNIIVGGFGQTIVADWGLACTLSEAITPGQPRLGTPGFMSPEAARGGPLDARTDVYGLGAILFLILTGRPPPPAPAPPVRAIAPNASPELSAIADRALTGALDRRYPDAGALAADLQAWLDGRPVAAHRYTVAEELSRRLRAWRVPLLVGAAALVGLLVAGALGWRATAQERDRARSAEDDAVAARAESEAALGLALAGSARQAAADGDQATAEILAAAALLHGPSPDARGVLAKYGGTERISLIQRTGVPGCAALDLSGDGRYAVCETERGLVVRSVPSGAVVAEIEGRAAMFAGHAPTLLVASEAGMKRWTPEAGVTLLGDEPLDGNFAEQPLTGVVAAASRSLVHWYDPRTDHYETGKLCANSGMPQGAAASANGDLVYSCSDRTIGVRRHDDGTTRVITQLELHEGVPAAVAADSGATERVAVGTARGHVLVLDAESGAILHRLTPSAQAVHALALLGDRVAAATTDGTTWLWDLRTNERIGRIDAGLADIEWRDGGRVLRMDGPERSDWSIPQGGRPQKVVMQEGISALSMAPSGDRIAISAGDGDVRVVSTLDGAVVAELGWQSGVAKDVAFSPDGRTLAVGATHASGKRVFDTRTWQPTPLEGAGARRLTWLPDGSMLVLEYGDGVVHLTPSAGGFTRQAFATDRVFYDLQGDAGSEPALEDREDGIWRWRDGVLQPIGTRRQATTVAPFGASTLAVGVKLEILDANGAVATEWALPSPGTDVTVSPDGRRVAVGHANGTATVWTLPDGVLVARFTGHAAKVSAVEFSPDGRWLWTGSWDGTARPWFLDGLETPAATLLPALEASWGMDVATALSRVAAR